MYVMYRFCKRNLFEGSALGSERFWRGLRRVNGRIIDEDFFTRIED